MVIDSPLEVFNHFFTDDLYENITEQTNLYAKQALTTEEYEAFDKVTVKEIQAFISLWE